MINVDIIAETLNHELNKSNTIYVLKGFNFVITDLNIDCKHIFNMNIEADIYNLLQVNHKQLLKEINSLDGEPRYCLYEEMLLVQDVGIIGTINIMDYDIEVIDFNVFDYYYPGFKQQENYTKLLEDVEQTTLDTFMQKIYSFVAVYDETLVVSYNPLSSVKIEKNLFDYESVKVNDLVGKALVIHSNINNINFPSIFSSLYKSDYSTIRYVFTGEKSFSIEKFLNNISHLDIAIKEEIEEIKEKIPPKYNQYESILKRINPDYTFKYIDIYRDPFSSNEKIKLNQSVIIDNIVENIQKAQDGESYRDIFVTAPTGAGKSILFQIPAIYHAETNKLLTIVVSPLIELMKDQVNNLKKMTESAATLNSEFTPYEKDDIKARVCNGDVSILYLSPETLLSNVDITSLIGDRQIGFFVIDEAHTVSTWGKNFRPDYWYLGDYIYKLRHRGNNRFPIATFTATSTIGNTDDMYHDIIESLKMTPISYIGDVRRYNIEFDIKHCKKEHDYIVEKYHVVIDQLIEYCFRKDEKTLVYFPYKSTLIEIYKTLEKLGIGKRFAVYYGGLDKNIKNESVANFKDGVSPVMLATKAFGMGIDIKDIKNVYHFAPTGNIPDYVQEIGRVGRDQNIKAIASTHYFNNDFRYIKQLYGMSQITNYQIVEVLKKVLTTYNYKKKRNFLIAPEEYMYIFDGRDQEEIERKLKTAFLIIKKDFELDEKLNYAPIIFKPRGLYTKGIFLIPDSKIDVIKDAGILHYAKLIRDKEGLTRIDNFGAKHTYMGDLYEFDFKRFWEDRYPQVSFGYFKAMFFNDELDYIKHDTFIQKVILVVTSKKLTFNIVLEKFTAFMYSIKDILDDYHMSKKHFTNDIFADEISQKTKLGIRQCKVIATPLLNMLDLLSSSINNHGAMGGKSFFKYNKKNSDYSICSSIYTRAIFLLVSGLNKFFYGYMNSRERDAVVNKTDNNMRTDPVLIGVQILELLNLASYAYQAGDRPEYFVRVNSEFPINKIIDDSNYKSKTVENIRMLHNQSVDYMQYFFEKLENSKERWDFIENYFLGKDLSNEVDEYLKSINK